MQKQTYSPAYHYRRLLSFAWKENKSTLFRITGMAVSHTLASLVSILIPAVAVGLLQDGASLGRFVLCLALGFVLYGLMSAAESHCEFYNEVPLLSLRNAFLERFLTVVMTMDYGAFERMDAQGQIEKAVLPMASNMEGLEGFYHNNQTLLINLLGLAAYAALAAAVHPLILVLLLALCAIQLAVFRAVDRYRAKLRDPMSKHFQVIYYLQKITSNVREGKDIRLYGLAGWLADRYTREARAYEALQGKGDSALYGCDVVSVVLGVLRDAVAYGYLIYLLIQGMDVSLFVLNLGVITGFAQWFSALATSLGKIGADMKLLEPLWDFLDRRDDNAGQQILAQPGDGLDLRLDHVSFSYPGSDQPVLQDVSFHLKPGQTFALVGVNGAGKSTLVKLLCGFYRPTAGHIYVNGKDLQDLDRTAYQALLAAVFQEVPLLSTTIAQNITAQMDEQQDRARLLDAVKEAGLWEKLQTLPHGVDTYIGKDLDPDGIQLSGGQVQRLALARAIYKQAPLVLLDEPTAAMDALAEQETYLLYRKVLAKRSVLFISHRLASTQFCDHILFLEHGRIIEEGTHEALLARNGAYTAMFQVQSQYYNEQEPAEKEDM